MGRWEELYDWIVNIITLPSTYIAVILISSVSSRFIIAGLHKNMLGSIYDKAGETEENEAAFIYSQVLFRKM